uniref:Uncharacterized protein n=1 Tax=Arundo donax TaxID=35708 RepID=A0A0A9CYT2_ARUDO
MCFYDYCSYFQVIASSLGTCFPKIDVVCSICILATIGKYIANAYHKSPERAFVIWNHSEVDELKGVQTLRGGSEF